MVWFTFWLLPIYPSLRPVLSKCCIFLLPIFFLCTLQTNPLNYFDFPTLYICCHTSLLRARKLPHEAMPHEFIKTIYPIRNLGRSFVWALTAPLSCGGASYLDLVVWRQRLYLMQELGDLHMTPQSNVMWCDKHIAWQRYGPVWTVNNYMYTVDLINKNIQYC